MAELSSIQNLELAVDADSAATIASLQVQLDRAIELLLRAPGRKSKAWKLIAEVSAAVERLTDPASLRLTPGVAGHFVQVLSGPVTRIHQLMSAGLEFQCGALLTNPAVEYTYTPAGEMSRASAGASLSLEG